MNAVFNRSLYGTPKYSYKDSVFEHIYWAIGITQNGMMFHCFAEDILRVSVLV